MIEERSWGSHLFDVINHVFLAALAISCLLPLIHELAVSLSGAAAAKGHLVGLWPVQYNLETYRKIIGDFRFRAAFMISATRTVSGTLLNMFIVVLTAYPLALVQHWRGRGVFKAFLLFGLLFSGGLIPTFLLVKNLGLINRFPVLILPDAVSIWSVIIMTNFFRGLPEELAEAAQLDGASHWDTLFRVYLPISTPGLATLGLFTAVGHWNSWFDGLIYINDASKYPLQTLLKVSLFSGFDNVAFTLDPESAAKLSKEALDAGKIIVATVPILMAYPFLQRYFVKGLILGSVKG